MKKHLNTFRQIYIFLILIIIYLPLLIVVLISFNGSTSKGNINLIFGVPESGAGGSAYDQLLEDGSFSQALLNSFIVALVSTPVSVIIATMTAFAIWNNKKFYNKASIAISSISISTPEVIAGLSLMILFAATWLSFNRSLGLFTIIVSHISFCTPYAFVAIYPRMQKMNKNLILASDDLGYSKVATFFKVTIPYLLPAILSGAAIAFAMSFDDFIITNLVRGSTQTVSTQLYLMRKGVKAWAAAFGAIIVLLTIGITAIFVIHKALVERNKHREKVIKRSQKLTKLNLRSNIKKNSKTVRVD